MVTLLLTIGGVQNTFAQASYNHTYTQGVEVTEGDNYFLYNIGSGMFLTDGMDYGTHASVDHAGRIVKLETNSNGFSIHTRHYAANGSDDKAGYMTLNGYVDTGTNDADWVFTPVTVSDYTNAYTIKNSDTQYLYWECKDGLYQGKAGQFINVGESTNDNYSYWLLIPMSTRQAVQDYTYMLRNTDFCHPWEFVIWNTTADWTNYCGGNKENTCAEMINKAFNVSQTISVTVANGKYQVYAQAFYRNDDTNNPAYLYANDDEEEIAILNANGENTTQNMGGASTAFSAGQYVNSVTTVVTNGSLKVGIKNNGNNWTIFDNFYVKYLGQTLSTGIAIELPEGGAMTAGQWYYFDVNNADDYSFDTTTPANIIFTADGTLLESEANNSATALPSGNTNLTAGRYYIKSSTANNFALVAPRPTTAQITELSSLIAAGEAKTLGFDNGEYAPYNNIEALTLLADAQTLDLNTPNQYTQSFIAGKITALQNATWTANSGEVNAIDWKTDYTSADIASDNYIHPVGWTNTGYNTRIYSSTAGNVDTNTGISAVGGTAIMFKYNTTYGEPFGYTMPLKANTYYKIAFKYCGWGNTPTTNVVLTGPNGGVTVTPVSFRPETNNGNTNADNWYDYTGVFKTGADAGNYVLALNKVDGGQQQIGLGNMVLVRAVASDLPYTPATGAMNAEVAAAQTAAVNAFEANKTFENYEALIPAIQAAEASVAEYQRIAARLALLAAQTGDIPQATFESSTTYTNYTNGVYTSLDEVVPQFKTDVAAYWSTNAPAANTDLTAFIVNQGFEFGDLTGWNLPQGTSGGDGTYVTTHGGHGPENASEGTHYYHTYWTGKPVQQTISGLPNGTYQLSAVLAGNDVQDEHVAFIYAGDSHAACTLPGASAGTWQSAVTLDFVVTNGTVTLGAIGGKQDNTFDFNNPWIFFSADNFRLTYLSADATVAPSIPEGQMNADVKAAMLAAKATYETTPSVDNYNALVTAINNANASIALYEQINTRLEKLTAASQRGGLNEAQVKALAFYTKYSDGVVNETADETTGTYTSLDQVVPEYKANIATYYATNAPAAGADVTAFIVNNGFEFGDETEWAKPHGQNWWANAIPLGNGDPATQATATSDGDYVFHTGWKGVPVQQTINNLPNGTYRMIVALLSGDNAEVPGKAFLYANDKHSDLITLNYDAARTFTDYTFDFIVNNGTATLGVVGGNDDGTWREDGYFWYEADNFRLTYLSAEATIAPELVVAPMNADIATAQTSAYNTWNAEKSVANYNALLEAIAAAQVSADKYVIINQRIPKLDDQTSVDVSALTTKYNNGEYVEADDVFTAYSAILGAYYTTNPPADNADLTAFIINPSFEFGNTDGWDVAKGVDTGAKDANNGTYAFSNSDGDYVFNTWSNWNPEQFLYVVQDVKNLPNGTYELSAVWATEDGYRTVEFTAENVLPGNNVEGQQVTDTFRPVDIDTRATKATGLERSVTITVTDGTLRIGGHGYQFFKCDNFRLKFLGAGLVDPDLTQPMNRYEKEYYENARDAYLANPTPENLRKANEYRIMVENSIKAYAAAKVTLDHVQEMMDKTNVYTYDAFFTIDDLFRKYGFAGYYGFRTLEDDQAYELERMFFGTGIYRDHSNFSIPAVPFIASAWDCGYQDAKHKGYAYAQDGWVEGADYYANTWSREGNDDGTHMLTPYLEYWKYGDDRLSPRTMTATVEGTPNATYTVKMFVRVRIDEEYTVDGNNEVNLNDVYPQGMTIQIGDGAEFTPTWTPVRNEGSIYILNNYRKLWVCNLWDENDPTKLPTGNVGSDGTLQIKFNIKNGSNVTWLSMKDVFVNYETEIPAVEMAKLRQQIAYAKLHTPGFDEGDYAPYTNVEQLIALHRAEQVEDAPKNVFLVRAVTKALKALNYSGDKAGDDDGSTVLAYDASTDQWNKNTEEMNAFYWTNDYTSADVEHIEWYDYEDDCITPTGWDLIGRDDGFNTGIKKLGVNTGDNANGMKSVDGETVLYAKYETSYGEEPGYTVPLEKGVKYIMTFTYTYAGEGTCPETRVTLTVPEAGANADDTATSGLEVTRFTPAENGVNDMSKWYMYRATFTPTYENEETGEWANYLITFDKDNYDPEPIMFGELTLVRYKEADDVINGDSRDYNYSYEPEFIGTDVKLTRSFNAGAYNTLVLPFKLSGSELKEALGNNFNGKVYYYTGVGTTTGETRDYYQLKFEERTGGIFANVPVLFYSDATNPVNNWTNKTFTNMVTKYVKNDLTVDTDVFDFVGTYKTQRIPEGGWYIKADNNFYKSTGSASLSPTRGYFIPYNTEGEVILHAKIMGFDIDDEPTGIMAIEEDGTMHVTSGNIYSVDGRLVRQNATSLEGLPRGTYIVDGKKYMIK